MFVAHWQRLIPGLDSITGFACCSSQSPRPQIIAATMGPHTLKATHVTRVALRAVEAARAILKQRSMSLSGDVEVDCAALRSFRVGPQSVAWQDEVAQWERISTVSLVFFFPEVFRILFTSCASLRQEPEEEKPLYFLTHLRWAGAIERGCEGRLLLHKLPFTLLVPGARPAVESLQDVRPTQFLEKLERPVTVHADGAKVWRSECTRQQLAFRNVVHCSCENAIQ